MTDLGLKVSGVSFVIVFIHDMPLYDGKLTDGVMLYKR